MNKIKTKRFFFRQRATAILAFLLLLFSALSVRAEPLRGTVLRVSPADGSTLRSGGVNRTIKNLAGMRMRKGGSLRAGEKLCFRVVLDRGDAGRKVALSFIPPQVGAISVSHQKGLSCGPTRYRTSNNQWGGFVYVMCQTTGTSKNRDARFCVTPPAAMANQRIRVRLNTPDNKGRQTLVDVGVLPPVADPLPVGDPDEGDGEDQDRGPCIKFADLHRNLNDYDAVAHLGAKITLFRLGQNYYTFKYAHLNRNANSSASFRLQGNAWVRTLCPSGATDKLKLKDRGNLPNPQRNIRYEGRRADCYYLEKGRFIYVFKQR